MSNKYASYNFSQALFRSPFLKPIRNLFRPIAPRWPWPVRVQMENGLSLYLDLRSGIGREIFVKGYFDKAICDFLVHTLKEGDVFIDIGANIGYYSILALSRVSTSGEVHAFEVDPRSIRCLRLTQLKNNLCNFVIHSVALGEKSDIISLITTQESGYTYIHKRQKDKILFPILPLDTWLEYYSERRAALIKIDVEGAELYVLRGAKKIIEQCHPIIVCEATERAFSEFGYSSLNLINYMEKLGYKSKELAGAYERTLIFYPEEQNKI